MLANRRSENTFIAIILMLSGSFASAADYSAGFNMSTGVSHNDNIRLVQRDKTEVRKYNASPTLAFGAATETSVIKFDSTFDFNRYDKDEFDSDDQHASLILSHQFENSSIALNTAYINNTTTTSELLTSGRVGLTAERAKQYQISPQWVYGINETNLIQIQASYISQDYGSDAYTGYENIGTQTDWMYKISERMSWITSLTYSDYQSDSISVSVPSVTLNVPPYTVPKGAFGEQSYAVRTKNKGINIGFKYEWSEQTLVETRLGRSKNKTTYPIKDPENLCERLPAAGFVADAVGAFCSPIPSSDAFSSTADITWRWQNERQQISLNGTKETQPTSNGYAVDAIQISSNWNYRLTELDEFSATITLVRNRAIDDKSALQNASLANRDYEASTLAYERQLNEDWFLRTSYQFSKQRYTETDNEAHANLWALSINYRPQQWHWAR